MLVDMDPSRGSFADAAAPEQLVGWLVAAIDGALAVHGSRRIQSEAAAVHGLEAM